MSSIEKRAAWDVAWQESEMALEDLRKAIRRPWRRRRAYVRSRLANDALHELLRHQIREACTALRATA